MNVVRLVAILTFLDGHTEVLPPRRCHWDEHSYLIERLVSSFVELASVVDWRIRIYVDGRLYDEHAMDDVQSEYDHGILIRDNLDALHYRDWIRRHGRENRYEFLTV